MDKHQLQIEKDQQGLVHLSKFMVCPVLHSFINTGAIECSQYEKPLSNFLQDRLKYLLNSYFETQEIKSDRYDQWKHIVTFSINQIRPGVNVETWSRYKSVLRHTLNIGLKKELAPLELIRNWISEVVTSEAPDKKTLKAITSRNSKADKITPTELIILRLNIRTESERFAVDWLETSICTGIRPVEIKTSQLHYREDGNFLECENVIKSDKTAKKLANGEFDKTRTISLSHVSFHSLKLIEKTINEYQFKLLTQGGHQEVYSSARTAIRDISIRALGYRVSLSVGRKQFSANKKALGESEESLAYDMGHTDVTRARRSYGKKNNGFAKRAKPPETNDE